MVALSVVLVALSAAPVAGSAAHPTHRKVDLRDQAVNAAQLQVRPRLAAGRRLVHEPIVGAAFETSRCSARPASPGCGEVLTFAAAAWKTPLGSRLRAFGIIAEPVSLELVNQTGVSRDRLLLAMPTLGLRL